MFIWIIDEEWEDYIIEKQVIHSKIPGCTIAYSGLNYFDEIDEIGKNVDAVICQINIPMTKEIIDKLPKCKVISVYGVGYDKVDIAYAKEKNISVTNVSSYCVDDVSDYVISALYKHNKMLSSYSKNVSNRLWGAQAVKRKIHRLSSQCLFIAGFGKIGKEIARKAKLLGMDILFYDPYVTQEQAVELGVCKVELHEGLKKADFISLNMQLNDSTKNLITMNEFKMMKQTAHIINASRGGIINEADLIEAVNNGVIDSATLDVVSSEPPEQNLAILHCDKIFVTPHISYLSQDSLNELQQTAAENAVGVLLGEYVRDIVNR